MIPALLLLLALPLSAPGETVVLPLRERARVRDAWLEERLDTIVPALMREHDFDLWLLIAREYNEDPVVKTMLPATWLNARRRTILCFHDRGGEEGVERFCVSRYAIGDLFPSEWNKEEQPDQWARVAELIAERDPERIAINVSPDFALADGMSVSQHEGLLRALPEELAARVTPTHVLALGWLETRTPSEMEVYPTIARIAHEIIFQGLSADVVQPGVTTTEDLQWWFRERIAERKLQTWFHPSVSVQRAEAAHSGSFADERGVTVIRRGDFLHIDLGITYLGLNTDTQQHAYVLRAGETEAPAGLRAGLAAGNRVQDLLCANYRTGRTGNEVLAATREQALAEQLVPSVYTHPLGLHGHAAGATIGLWDQQGGVPGKGDYPLRANTVWAIELNATHVVPEWGDREILFMLEEDAFFDGETVRYLDGRQTEIILIP